MLIQSPHLTKSPGTAANGPGLDVKGVGALTYSDDTTRRPRAIETVYKGYRFRSRLEARWAVFFDALGVRWEYEKEGYELGAAGRYLPDFWLPDLECWVEIKPAYPEAEEMTKIAALAEATGFRAYLFDHPEFEVPRWDAEARFRGAWGRVFWPERYDDEGDFGAWWMVCSDCGGLGVGDPRDVKHKVACCTFRGVEPASLNGHDRLKLAYLAAKQARFEFGEHG